MNNDLDFHKHIICNLISELKEGARAAELTEKYRQLSEHSELLQQLMKLLIVEDETEKATIQGEAASLVTGLVKNPALGLSTEEKKFYSLKNLSFRVYEILKDVNGIHYDEICNRILMEARGDEGNVKRRIYDILNVLVAAGLLCKEQDKNFCLNPRWNGGSILKKRERANLLLEESNFKQKLVLRNMENKTGASVFPLPVLCFRVAGKYQYNLANKGKTSQLTLKSDVPIETIQELALLKKVKYN